MEKHEVYESPDPLAQHNNASNTLRYIDLFLCEEGYGVDYKTMPMHHINTVAKKVMNGIITPKESLDELGIDSTSD